MKIPLNIELEIKGCLRISTEYGVIDIVEHQSGLTIIVDNIDGKFVPQAEKKSAYTAQIRVVKKRC